MTCAQQVAKTRLLLNLLEALLFYSDMQSQVDQLFHKTQMPTSARQHMSHQKVEILN